MSNAKSKAAQKAAKPIPDGQIQVEFDAGGKATFVNPNPVRPLLQKKKTGDLLILTWTLAESPLHANSQFEVFFGNVIPCFVKHPFLNGLKSQSGVNGKSWTWKWPNPVIPPDQEFLIYYDVFFCYQPKGLLAAGKPPQHQFIVSARETAGADPTLILPPKAGG